MTGKSFPANKLAVLALAVLAGLAASALASPYGNAVTTDGPVGWWRLDDGTDYLGAHTTSVVGTGVSFGQTGAIAGDASASALFNGTTDGRLTIDDAADLNFGHQGDFSVEAWFQTTATGTRTIANKGDTNAGYWLRLQNGAVRFFLDYGGSSLGNPGTSVITTATNYNDGAWHHVVGVAQRDTAIRLYIDGQMAAETPIAPPAVNSVSSPESPLEIGQLTGLNPFNGYMDEVALYSHTLDAANIQARYQVGSGLLFGSYADMVVADSPLSWWRLDDANDSMGLHGGLAGPGVTFGQAGAIAGDFSASAWFDGGSEATILIADAPDLDFGGETDFAVEAWVKRDVLATGKSTILNKGTSAGSFWLRFEADGTLRFLLDYGSASDDAQSTLTYNDGAWHHVVGVADRDNSVQLYVDGVLVDEDPVTVMVNGVSNTLPLDVGQMNNANFFDGLVDELAVYNVALSDAQVLAHYAAATATTSLPGDADRSGVVDKDDAARLAANWLKAGGATWGEGDFNNDGNVDDLDLAILAANWSPAGAGVAVPEPSVLIVLIGLALAAAVARVRRRRGGQ
ncbi:MAG: hypothetical protein JW809_10815 [Pirellulales bacterium]|nr:hypothetical protein [Pirellulales bacterium]